MPSLTDAWARQVTYREEFPEPFWPFIDFDRPLPYLIYSPPDAWGNRKVNARLTVLSEQGVTVLENTPDGVRSSEWLFDEIDYVEQGAVHLYSWLRLSGVAGGRPASVQVEYNAVVAPLFTRVVQAVRRSWTGTGNASLAQEQAKLAGLAAVDYKFWSYARDSLLPGERMLGQVYQPEIDVPWLLFFQRRVVPAYVSVLTDKELICISDDGSDGNTGRYGIVHRYVPLTKIKDWQLIPAIGEQTGIWRLQLTGEGIALCFSAPVQDFLLELADLLEEARGKKASLSEH